MIVIQGNLKKTKAYKTLGLTEGATKEQIKKAYKELSLKYHPDKSKEENANEMFIKVKDAYDILSNSVDDKKSFNYVDFKHIFTFEKGKSETEKEVINIVKDELVINPSITPSHNCAVKIGFARKNVHLCENHRELDGSKVWKITNTQLSKNLNLFIIGGELSFTNQQGNNIPKVTSLTIGTPKTDIFSEGHDLVFDGHGIYKVMGKNINSVKDVFDNNQNHSNHFKEKKEPYILKETLKSFPNEEIGEVKIAKTEEFNSVKISGNSFSYDKLFKALNPNNIKAPEGFNPLLYWLANPEIAKNLISPEVHYVEKGMSEGLDAGIHFKEENYKSKVKDEIDGVNYRNGFEHFSKKGCLQGLSPDDKFDVKKYLDKSTWRAKEQTHDDDQDSLDNQNSLNQPQQYDQCYFFKCINEAIDLIGSNEVHYCKDLYFNGLEQSFTE